ncbi:hypothetical protein QR680_000127 [Steinernema hermaphroditum]|uniref:Protein HTATIP2 n=1 Tax=Steinernema hermaphroditum TaxID=289476 RepID=A0AA39LDR7_9BILA|nr:hypothetical protein QR680_000127 [Steinernema hermaphroditum]
MSYSVLLFGASGAVGSQLLKCLNANATVEKIIYISRREVPLEEAYINKVKVQVVDFENLDASKDAVEGCNAAFCALGTTRAKAGADGFYKVDHDYVVNAAKLSKDIGCKSFCLISSQGADENSRFLYLKTKGQTEKDTMALNFERCVVARPAFLRNRGNDFRWKEMIVDVLMTPVRLVMPTKFTVDVTQVAKASIYKTLSDETGPVILENDDLHRLATEYDA